MPAADLVIQGTVLTVDEAQPTAEAIAVSDGRIVAVGDRSDVEGWIGPETQTIDLGDGCVMPGLVEAHGHPLMEAVVLSDRMVDIRPVTMRRRGRRRRRDPRRGRQARGRGRLPQWLGPVAAERPSRADAGLARTASHPTPRW